LALVVAIACWTAAAADVAFAQGKGKDEKDAPVKGYTLPYFFTLIGGLAMVVPVCMPSSRKWDIAADEEEAAA
jgi:hypothetical protein